MPFGESGSEARVHSPDGGFVQSFEDTQERFYARFQNAYGPEVSNQTESLGLFTEDSLFSVLGVAADRANS